MSKSDKKPTNAGAGDSRRDQARARAAELRAKQQSSQRRRNLLVQGGVGLCVLIAVVGLTVAVLSSRDSTTAATAPTGLTKAGGVVVGSPTAPVTIAVVEDFGCPACGAFEASTGDLLASYAAGKDVKVEYRAIAFLDRAFSDEYSSRALNAAACTLDNAGAEAWKKLHDGLYNNQPSEGGAGLTDAQLIDLAKQAGADGDVERCIRGGRFRDWGESMTKKTLTGEVTGTPTVFVNGKVVEAKPETIRAAVAKAQQ